MEPKFWETIENTEQIFSRLLDIVTILVRFSRQERYWIALDFRRKKKCNLECMLKCDGYYVSREKSGGGVTEGTAKIRG